MDNITKQDVADMRKGLALCAELEQKLERGESCGINCQAMRDECRVAKEMLTKYLAIYGPQFPAKSN